jgi:hypothetical protein
LIRRAARAAGDVARTLATLLRGCPPGVRLNEHLTHPGDVVFRHACKTGLEGIVSKRLGSERPLEGLDQDEEPGGIGGSARRRKIGAVKNACLGMADS